MVAGQVWTNIVSEPAVHEHSALRRALLAENGFDFEHLLFRAQLLNEFPNAERSALEAAILAVFDRIERRLFGDLFRVSIVDVTALFAEFCGIGDAVGLLFTLNQDMLFERLFWVGHGGNVARPGVSKPIRECPVAGWNHALRDRADPNEKVVVETLLVKPDEDWPKLTQGTQYLKLHGSWDWRTPDGDGAMILGGGKAETIELRPLLKFYFEVFREFLRFGDRRLLVIGYGFGDHHVNVALADAVKRHGLRLHIWDVHSPATMRSHILRQQAGEDIWSGLCGYTQSSVADLFPQRSGGDADFISESATEQILRVFGTDVRNPLRLLPH